MSKTFTLNLESEEATNLVSAIKDCIAEIDRARENIKHDQDEIDILKAETHTIIERIKKNVEASF
ncbi:MAG: hypothetical protein MSG64_02970 [Pyrinomonadaceae bacterium MAG19_C2-C3]|nr:hypothetical protein [Pyrinomonadaceae bacterium MAG19_C2-C3]